MNISQEALQQLVSLIKSDSSLSFVRSSGSGGQNVNKVSSKVELRWPIEQSVFVSPAFKNRFRQLYQNQINQLGELILTCQVSRNQSDNVSEVFKKLTKMIKAAMMVPKPRVLTKPTYSAKRKRLTEKNKQGEKKLLRRKPNQ